MKDDVTAVEIPLYELRRAIYPRAVHGWFAAWRWTLVWATQIVFYGGPWLQWNGRQAVLFDIAHRKFYIFGLVFWPQDAIQMLCFAVFRRNLFEVRGWLSSRIRALRSPSILRSTHKKISV